MRKILGLLFILTIILVVSVTYVNQQAKQVITYFPLDKNASFITGKTKLTLANSTKDKKLLRWDIHSQTDAPFYLRQDVSLLYANGTLKGIRSKWKENTDTIQMEETVPIQNDTLWEAISFHYGEIHYPKDIIKSVQMMSEDQLYTAESNKKDITSFRSPEDNREEKLKENLDKVTKKKLLRHWQDLLSHFKLNINQYDSIPLTSLAQYEKKNFPGFTQKQTEQIIGQLWEGLYKNYVIPASNNEDRPSQSYVPLILIDKQHTQLIVLFELNGKYEKLIQQLPEF
ncbi:MULTISPECIES: hypothetical protein [unclassified Virgibacillus]|uniref:hypothetical protein n=1 Tax=unclassified Virgibacillus TaxID=2620237 RepID=UPI0024DE2BB5|nr:hypothetical protein [Virgibacillus sp. LDC-1]